LALEESTNDDDIVIEVEGITFLVEPNQSRYFDNVELSYRKGIFGSGEFTVKKV